MSCKAFTLIELLVVIAILGLLAAVLFPVFAGVRERGRRTVCLSNLRQLHLTVTMYASDHDGLLPPYGTDFGSGFGSTSSRMEKRNVDHAAELTAALNPYLRGPELWFCPSDGFARTDSKAGTLITCIPATRQDPTGMRWLTSLCRFWVTPTWTGLTWVDGSHAVSRRFLPMIFGVASPGPAL